MAGMPTLSMKLDDGSGTFPYDISTRVRMAEGVVRTYGRGDQWDTVQPGQMTFTADNADGLMTLGAATYGLAIGQACQWSLTVGGTTSKRFTGYLDGITTSWPSGGQEFSTTAIRAVDRLARLNRQTLGNQIRQEILALNPVAYYPFDEPATAASFSNISPVQGVAPSSIANDAGSGVTPGVAGVGVEGTPFAIATVGGTGVNATTFTGTSTALSAGSIMAVIQTSTPPPVSSSFKYIFRIFTTGGYGSYSIGMDSSGRVGGATQSGISGFASAVNYADGQPHLVVVRGTGTGTLEFVIDGVLVNTSTPGSTFNSMQITGVQIAPWVAGTPSFPTSEPQWLGSLSHAALFTTSITTAQALALWNVIKTGSAGESSATRIAHLAQYAGFAASDVLTETPALTAVPAQPVQGQSPLSAIQSVSDAEGGLLFVGGDDKLIVQNRSHRALRIAANMTPPTSMIQSDISVPADTTQIKNYVTGSRQATTGQSPTLISQDATSINFNGYFPDDLGSLLVSTDSEVQDRADFTVAKYKNPAPRMPSVTLDLLTATQANQQAAMGLELSDRLGMPTLPSQAPAVGDQVIEGWTETLKASAGDAEWSLACNTTAWSLVSAFILNDTTYGVLDSTTPLGY